MLAKVRSTIRRFNLLNQGDRVIVGVSGGPDSIALLNCLHKLSAEYALQLHVAHLNHMFRGEEARQDADFVAATAAGWGIPTTVQAVDVPALVREKKISAQAAGREVRRTFLEGLLTTLKFNKIALGHQADDQAETLLLHLLRGSGLAGLAGMQPQRGFYIRPLLEVRRREIDKYLREEDLDFREDPSNRKPVYLRNRIRHELLPLLERSYNPRFTEALVRTARIVQDDEHCLQELAEEVFKQISYWKKGEIALTLGGFCQQHPSLQRRVIFLAQARAIGRPGDLTFDQVEMIRHLAVRGGNGRVELGNNIDARTEGRDLIIGARSQPEPNVNPFKVPLPVPGEVSVTVAGCRISARIINREDISSWPPTAGEALLDADQVREPLVVRSRQPGDRFWPLGASGMKKVKDFLIDRKIPLNERQRLPLITGEEAIYWLAGMRIDHRCRITPATARVLWLKMVTVE